MQSGRQHPYAWSNFATFGATFGDATRNHHSVVSNSVKEGHAEQSTTKQVGYEDLSGNSELDKEQILSAAFVEDEQTALVSSPLSSPSPIPASVSQATNISSSPAAMFLSAFMGSKPEPEPLPDDEGQKVAGYTLGKIIGFGGFSTIKKAFSDTGGVVAVKIIRRGDLVRTGHAPEERKRLQHEAAIWSSLSHEHILPLFSVVNTSYADYFITIYCPAGSLYDILKRDGQPALPQDDAGMMFRQVVRGLRYLHEVALLVHRDMKLENVLVDETGVCRIGDFGLSVKIGDVDDEEALLVDQHEYPRDGTYGNLHRTKSMSVSSKRIGKGGSSLANAIARHSSTRHRNSSSSQAVHNFQPGSLPYAAPELLLPHTFELNSTHPSQDIWALGVMLYALLAGHLPFNDSFEPRLQMKILNGTFEVPPDIGRGAERILNGCMERNLAKRWTVAMVDEVAWGVGWGSAGDSATPEESQDLHAYPFQPHSAPLPDPADLSILESDEDDWQKEEHIPRSAIEAASRRSSSRAQRSLSRAPILTRTPSGCSISRRSRPGSPHRNGCSSSRFYSGLPSAGASRSHSPDDYDDDDETSLYDVPSRSRSQSRHRGRKPVKRTFLASRSPSPSVVPTTPVDIDHRLMSALSLRDPSVDLHLDSPPRGRTRFCLHHETFDEGDETEVEGKAELSLAETNASVERPFADWTVLDNDPLLSHERSHNRSSKHVSSWSLDGSSFVRRSRPGSTPPASAKSWELYRTKATQGILSRNGSQDRMLFSLTPPIHRSNAGSRSRSVDNHDPTLSPTHSIKVGDGTTS